MVRELHFLRLTLIVCLSCLGSVAYSQQRDCFDAAAEYHQVNVEVLRSIAIRENSYCDGRIRRNKNNTIDTGCMQINSVHFSRLAKYGITPEDLRDPCINIFVGAWHYKSRIIKYGNTWTAAGAYKSDTPSIRDQNAVEIYKIWYRYFGSKHFQPTTQ